MACTLRPPEAAEAANAARGLCVTPQGVPTARWSQAAGGRARRL